MNFKIDATRSHSKAVELFDSKEQLLCTYNNNDELVYGFGEVNDAGNFQYPVFIIEEEHANIGTHTTHCCAKHGCKYGNTDCPVANNVIKQVYPCEDCIPGRDYEKVGADVKIVTYDGIYFTDRAERLMNVICLRQNVPDMTDEEFKSIVTVVAFNLKEIAEENITKYIRHKSGSV